MIKFTLIGTGYRSEFYIRVALNNKDKLNLVGVLARNNEKINYLTNKYNIYTTLNENDLFNLKPDFIVVCVDKTHILDTSIYYASLGYPILMETPAALNLLDITKFKDAINKGYKIQVAEQYIRYPYISKLIELLDSNIIGDINSLELTYAHEYHAISIARSILKSKVISLIGKTYINNITRTNDRYNTYTDGLLTQDKETHIAIEYENNKQLFYNFSSSCYRSPIRNKYVHIKGTRGEIINNTIYYLDSNNIINTKKIDYLKVDNNDEFVLTDILLSMNDYINNNIEVYPNKFAIEDSYIAYLMRLVDTNSNVLIKVDDIND